MIEPWRVIALLTTSAATGRMNPGGGGSMRPSLAAASHAAALCAGMRPEWFVAALAKWGDRQAAKARLAELLHAKVENAAKLEGWRRVSPDQLEVLAVLATREFLLPQRPDGRPGRILEKEKAACVDVSDRAWRTTWRTRYASVAALPERWLAEAAWFIRERQMNGRTAAGGASECGA